MTLGICMIVKDEEDVLARCLDSIQETYDELIVVDTGSTDKTVEIAKTYTDKDVYKRQSLCFLRCNLYISAVRTVDAIHLKALYNVPWRAT